MPENMGDDIPDPASGAQTAAHIAARWLLTRLQPEGHHRTEQRDNNNAHLIHRVISANVTAAVNHRQHSTWPR